MVLEGQQMMAGWWMLMIAVALLIPHLLDRAVEDTQQPAAVPGRPDTASQKGARRYE